MGELLFDFNGFLHIRSKSLEILGFVSRSIGKDAFMLEIVTSKR